jgi:hypothetical protein
MGANLESSWQALGAIWRTGERRATTLHEQLATRVRRQSDRLRIIVAGEIVLTLSMLVASGAVIVRNAGASAVRTGAMVLLYTAAIWAFTLWNRRGIWSPYGESTADFVALLRLRAQRRIRTAWFCISVISLAAIVMSREIAAAWRVGTATLADWVWIALGAYSLSVVIWSVAYWRLARREIRELDVLSRELNSAGSL